MGGHPQAHAHNVEAARAALLAIREPSREALTAAATDNTPRTATNSLDRMFESVGHMHRALIDHILGEPTSPPSAPSPSSPSRG